MYFDGSPLSKSFITAKLLNLEDFCQYVVHLLFNVLYRGKVSEL